MKTKQVWANLPVKDVKKTNAFYTALGFTPNGGNEALTSFLVADNKLIVHFFQEEQLKAGLGGNIAIADATKSAEICFSLSADSKEEVNEWAENVKKAGGTIFLEPHDIPGNMYNFGFADPDGHRWNVLYCA